MLMNCKYKHWAFKLPVLKDFEAITIGKTVLFKDEENEVSENLKIHEGVHIEQIERHGWLGFYLIYGFAHAVEFFHCFDCGEAYRKNPFEMEAYARGSD